MEALDDNQGLIETVRRERALHAQAEAEKREEERRRLGIQDYQVEWGKDAPSGCTPLKITAPDGLVSSGIVCFGRGHRRRCEFCHKNWSVGQCDFPMGGPCKKCKGKKKRGGGWCHACAATGFEMCNKRVCKECRTHREPDEDYCPLHRVPAGFPALIKREPCQWMVKPRIVNRKCLHESCEVLISADDHVLFFPKRLRAMCESCGEKYLEVAK